MDRHADDDCDGDGDDDDDDGRGCETFAPLFVERKNQKWLITEMSQITASQPIDVLFVSSFPQKGIKEFSCNFLLLQGKHTIQKQKNRFAFIYSCSSPSSSFPSMSKYLSS